MELTLVGLQNSGKTTLVNVIAVSGQKRPELTRDSTPGTSYLISSVTGRPTSTNKKTYWQGERRHWARAHFQPTSIRNKECPQCDGEVFMASRNKRDARQHWRSLWELLVLRWLFFPTPFFYLVTRESLRQNNDEGRGNKDNSTHAYSQHFHMETPTYSLTHHTTSHSYFSHLE